VENAGYDVVIAEKFGQLRYYHDRALSKINICVVVLSNEEEVKSWELSASLAGLLLNQP